MPPACKPSDKSSVQDASHAPPAYDDGLELDPANPRVRAFQNQDHSWNDAERVFQASLRHPDARPRAMRQYNAYGPLCAPDAPRPADQSYYANSTTVPYYIEDYPPPQRPSVPMPIRDYGWDARPRDTRAAPYAYPRPSVGFYWEEFLSLRRQVALLREKADYLQRQIYELRAGCSDQDVPSREYRQEEDAFGNLSHLPDSVVRDFKASRVAAPKGSNPNRWGGY
ncbi:hypothetical protein EYR40_005085 [Pleurotus pulmonarius]|nr:hypothetical protein EYR36_006540 [Pleurotus pulmonarius]KAF4601238.1 hypothetical protein EYR38_005890 [Pleurotus pulmonarius]KAF4601885.1 hypothetical protein EYR40_005085 [Pleurotus pulmonarius]